jgi:hypothetical protein
MGIASWQAVTAAPCQLISSPADMPQTADYAPPYNVATGTNDLLMRVDCADQGATVRSGNHGALNYETIVYQSGYLFQNNTWSPFSYSGIVHPDDQSYLTENATALFDAARVQPGTDQYLVSFSCVLDLAANRWKCGCRDAACTTNHWQIQVFRAPQASGASPTQAPQDPPPEDWRQANVTWYTSYPEPGSDECINFNGCQWEGMFAGVSGKQTEEWVRSHDIAAVHERFFGDLNGKWLTIRNPQTGKTMDVQVLDMCADSDCNGCCTRNLGDEGFLIDLESYTAERFWGSPRNGVVEWRIRE